MEAVEAVVVPNQRQSAVFFQLVVFAVARPPLKTESSQPTRTAAACLWRERIFEFEQPKILEERRIAPTEWMTMIQCHLLHSPTLQCGDELGFVPAVVLNSLTVIAVT